MQIHARARQRPILKLRLRQRDRIRGSIFSRFTAGGIYLIEINSIRHGRSPWAIRSFRTRIYKNNRCLSYAIIAHVTVSRRRAVTAMRKRALLCAAFSADLSPD